MTDHLADPDGWFLLAEEGPDAVGMAAVAPLRADDGAGDPIPGGCFLSLMFVVPEQWGRGIGGALLDAVLGEAGRRGCQEMRLWTDVPDNERAHRLYRSRGFTPTGRTMVREDIPPAGEWVRSLKG